MTRDNTVMTVVVTKLFGCVRHDIEVVCVSQRSSGCGVRAGFVSWSVGCGMSRQWFNQIDKEIARRWIITTYSLYRNIIGQI